MGHSGNTLSVVLVDPHEGRRVGLRLMCEQDPNIQIVAEASDYGEGFDHVAQNRPNVVLIGSETPEGDFAELAKRLQSWEPSIRILVCVGRLTPGKLAKFLALGVQGLLSTTINVGSVALGIRAVACGSIWFSPDFAESIVAATRLNAIASDSGDESQGSIRVLLTHRESDVLTLIARGMTNEQIARQLNLGVETVKTHVRRIMDKTSNRSRRQLMDKVLNGSLPLSSRITPDIEPTRPL